MIVFTGIMQFRLTKFPYFYSSLIRLYAKNLRFSNKIKALQHHVFPLGDTYPQDCFI